MKNSLDDSDVERLEALFLGGEPHYLPCGCFVAIYEVCPFNANWVKMTVKRYMCLLLDHGFTPPHGLIKAEWRQRNGNYILETEWTLYKDHAEYFYATCW